MNRLKYSILAVGLLIGAASCAGNNPENNASSTPIDSTNVNGTAPATYGADNPAQPDSPKYEGGANAADAKANTRSSEDSAKGRY
ncbi:MAG: hypothetical protein EOP51_12110 [Sphingobacteriales bacterium]|nr:MAG: hypothetical protein EOP51_12110 [Sphingobacteriales bacterium]